MKRFANRSGMAIGGAITAFWRRDFYRIKRRPATRGPLLLPPNYLDAK